MHKVGILSDEHFRKNCIEYQPLKVGLAQKLFPMKPIRPGSMKPKELPIAQRGYNLTTTAISLAKRSGRPVEEVIQILKEETLQTELKRVKQIIPRVAPRPSQASLLAVRRKPRESDFDQVGRTVVSPTGMTGPEDETGPTGPTDVIR